MGLGFVLPTDLLPCVNHHDNGPGDKELVSATVHWPYRAGRWVLDRDQGT